MQSTDDLSSWKQQLAHVSAQIEGLRAWFEREQRALSSGVSVQLGQLAAEIHKLETEPASSGTAQHASDVGLDRFRTSPSSSVECVKDKVEDCANS